MGRRIEWNPNHKNAEEQEIAFVDLYLTWSANEKWEYLMELASQGLPKFPIRKCNRKIEWT